MEHQHIAIWKSSCEQLKTILSKDVYERWIAVIRCVGLQNEKLLLAVTNDFYKDWLEENYLPVIKKSVHLAHGHPLNVVLNVDSDCFSESTESVPKAPPDHPRSLPHLSSRSKNKSAHNLDSEYNFDNFVVGPANQFAHAAAMAATQPHARSYNPLFIYGGVGLGKTHLMQAIGNHVAHKLSRTKICYTTCESFTNGYIDALQNNSVSSFRKKYRKIDLLLIDDIQFLDGKNRLQEEFFHTFNALFENRRQIVLTSDRTPSEMAGLAPRLVSRFEWGLVTELATPDVETRTAILRKKVHSMNLSIDFGLLDYLAEQISSNIRSLEGALIRVATFVSLTNQKITIHKVDELLRDLLDKERRAGVSIEMIQRAVAEHFDIRLSDLASKKRSKDIAWPRQIAMYLARTMTSQSFPTIGEQFNRNHATILYAHKQVDEQTKTDHDLQKTISTLKNKVAKNCIKSV